ncbi:hypothetical protein [Sporosarcina sp. JAI121]|uniref:hypothetical protein n=1 Tax=Sporosarcina sp. JAI121 TaxID=2723064 RepID=UPI0015C9EA81|nr:hypothetical protein [Sporosarcina sp. JAI121]NYF26144.1 uncharacterized protein (DUF2267 family) [Sporosarcina sp. JAI121]
MDTKILYYKIFERNVEPVDYVNWAFKMLKNEISTTSLSILSSLSKPHNIFEVEDYFHRVVEELSMQEPSHEECAKYYIRNLLRQIIHDETNAINFAYEIYVVVREHFINNKLEIWYEISEMIDDFRYGDNIGNITKDSLITTIVQEAKVQLKSNFLLS